MAIQSISNHNMVSANLALVPTRGEILDGSAFRVYESQEKAPNKVKVGVALTTAAGILGTMAGVFYVKGKPFKTPSKFWESLTTIEYKNTETELPKLVLALGLGSLGGGLLGGALFDKKENMKAKYREAVIQMVGNIAIPLAFVMCGLKAFGKLEEKFPKALPEKAIKTRALKAIVSIGCLIPAIFIGNDVGNYINKKHFFCDDKRKIKVTDMSPHIDDLSIVGSVIAGEEFPIIPQLIPLALLIAGISTGVKQETPKMKHKEAVKKIIIAEKKKEIEKKKEAEKQQETTKPKEIDTPA